MKEAVFQYKCRMCGAIFGDSHINPDRGLVNLFDIKSTGHAKDFDALAIHFCDETRKGLADLIGYRIEGPQSPSSAWESYDAAIDRGLKANED